MKTRISGFVRIRAPVHLQKQEELELILHKQFILKKYYKIQNQMKKFEKTIKKRVNMRLKQTSLLNQNGLALTEKPWACTCCGKITKGHYVVSPIGLELLVDHDTFCELKEGSFIHWDHDTIEEMYLKGKVIFIDDLRFRIEDLDNGKGTYTAKAIVAKVGSGQAIEMHFNEERFADLQSILDYTVVDFEEDMESGEYYTEVAK